MDGPPISAKVMAEVDSGPALRSRWVRVDRRGTSPGEVNDDDVFVVCIFGLPHGADLDEWGGPPTVVEFEATFDTFVAALDAITAKGFSVDGFRSYWSFAQPA
jgi:hypothetical protein